MNVTSFDSLSAARKLREAGMEQGPAEAIAGLLHKVAVANQEDLMTKADLAAFEVRFTGFETGIKAELASAVNRIIFTVIVALGVLFAALKLF